MYSPALATLKPTLCAHTTPPPHPWPNIPHSRFNIVRHFSTKSHTVSFSCSALENVFEIRVPRLQIVRGNGGRLSRDPVATQTENTEPEEERRVLRREIKRWWEAIADHMDKLVSMEGPTKVCFCLTTFLSQEILLASNEERMKLKALPRLPSSDGDYDEFDTPKISAINIVNGITGLQAPPSTPVKSPWAEHDRAETSDSSPGPPGSPPPSPLKNTQEQTPAERLASLRHTFHRTEQSLYAQLGRTQFSSLNDVRRSFVASAKGAEKRLCAWQKKHISTAATSQIPERLAVEEPEWWGKKCHAVPGSNAIVHEDDWGSIISYALRFVRIYSHFFYFNLCLRVFLIAHLTTSVSLRACLCPVWHLHLNHRPLRRCHLLLPPIHPHPFSRLPWDTDSSRHPIWRNQPRTWMM